jgi:hypothetical protein
MVQQSISKVKKDGRYEPVTSCSISSLIQSPRIPFKSFLGLEERHHQFLKRQGFRKGYRTLTAAHQTGLHLVLHLFSEISSELS